MQSLVTGEAAVTTGVKATSEAEGVHTTVRVARVATAVGGTFVGTVVRFGTGSSYACWAVLVGRHRGHEGQSNDKLQHF